MNDVCHSSRVILYEHDSMLFQLRIDYSLSGGDSVRVENTLPLMICIVVFELHRTTKQYIIPQIKVSQQRWPFMQLSWHEILTFSTGTQTCATLFCYFNAMCVEDPDTGEAYCHCPTDECDSAQYYPMCSEGITFKSPCHLHLHMCKLQRKIERPHQNVCGTLYEKRYLFLHWLGRLVNVWKDVICNGVSQ